MSDLQQQENEDIIDPGDLVDDDDNEPEEEPAGQPDPDPDEEDATPSADDDDEDIELDIPRDEPDEPQDKEDPVATLRSEFEGLKREREELQKRLEKQQADMQTVVKTFAQAHPQTMASIFQGKPPAAGQPDPQGAPQGIDPNYIAQLEQKIQAQPQNTEKIVRGALDEFKKQQEEAARRDQEEWFNQKMTARYRESVETAEPEVKRTLRSIPKEERSEVLRAASEEYEKLYGAQAPIAPQNRSLGRDLYGSKPAGEKYREILRHQAFMRGHALPDEYYEAFKKYHARKKKKKTKGKSSAPSAPSDPPSTNTPPTGSLWGSGTEI